ncbi:MAG: N-(5'-phosphoribosyl)anthranilate isomerase [Acidimicrobiales bacterium]|nr:MAG: N-(5'-phosphoribosyl)anthranilate isomerase [Acidimicrobiales bacterium]
MFVKICGITSEDDALLAVALGADAVGFVFAPSPRQIAPVLARDIARRLPPEVLTVGVFRDEAPERVVEIVHSAGLDAVQLHGHETVADATYVKQRVRVLIQAFTAGDPAVERAGEYPADAYLLDGPVPGSGRVFDWTLTEALPVGSRLILAGGLDPENVQEAVSRVRPWGVDVSSGVERAPGRKDPIKLKEFIERARRAAQPWEGSDAAPPYDWSMDG